MVFCMNEMNAPSLTATLGGHTEIFWHLKNEMIQIEALEITLRVTQWTGFSVEKTLTEYLMVKGFFPSMWLRFF